MSTKLRYSNRVYFDVDADAVAAAIPSKFTQAQLEACFSAPSGHAVTARLSLDSKNVILKADDSEKVDALGGITRAQRLRDLLDSDSITYTENTHSVASTLMETAGWTIDPDA